MKNRKSFLTSICQTNKQTNVHEFVWRKNDNDNNKNTVDSGTVREKKMSSFHGIKDTNRFLARYYNFQTNFIGNSEFINNSK